MTNRWYGYGAGRRFEDTSFLYMLFYNDGSVLYNFLPPSASDPCDYFANVSSDKQLSESWGNYYYWGIYRIESDTVIVQYLKKVQFLQRFYGGEVRFKILDRNTILECRTCFRALGEKETQPGDFLCPNINGRFTHCDQIPPATSWLRKEDWTWCNNRK